MLTLAEYIAQYIVIRRRALAVGAEYLAHRELHGPLKLSSQLLYLRYQKEYAPVSDLRDFIFRNFGVDVMHTPL